MSNHKYGAAPENTHASINNQWCWDQNEIKRSRVKLITNQMIKMFLLWINGSSSNKSISRVATFTCHTSISFTWLAPLRSGAY